MKKISCVIIDDEPFALDLLAGYIHQVEHLELERKFDDPKQAISYLNTHEVDLLFLDIDMPGMNGMQLADNLLSQPSIIFTTAYSEYGAESYNKNALDYLLKPLNFSRFLIAINKYQTKITGEELSSDNKRIFIKCNGAFVQLEFKEIGYIESLKDYVIFHTQSKRYVVYHRLKRLEKILPANFRRVHYSYIINVENIVQIKDHRIQVFSAEIPLSMKYRKSIYELLEKRMI